MRFRGWCSSRLNRQGMTTVELLVAMFIITLILGGVPSLMHSINYYTRDAIIGVRNSRKESAAIASLIKDVKSSENVVISPDGKMITLQRSAGENGVSYAITGNALYYNDDVLIQNVIDGTFGQDGTVISATLNLAESEPIQLIMRRPSLKTLSDAGNAPVQPEFNATGTTFRFNGTLVNSTAVKDISIPVVPEYECEVETVDPMAQILWYTVDEGLGGGMGPRQYVEGNKAVFTTHGVLNTATVKLKVVAENGTSMAIYTVRLIPRGGDADPVPVWMWGGDEAFRMYMAREVFGFGSDTTRLNTVKFGQVRGVTQNLDFTLYNITEIGEIIGEFKQVQNIVCTDSWIDHLPDSLCKGMHNLRVLNLKRCNRLVTNCPDGSYATFRNNMLNTGWKNTNCRNVVVTWP